MIQEHFQKALKFAGEKHARQQVPGTNANYLLHISNVAMEVLIAYYAAPVFDINNAIQIAILHDTLEDTDTSFEELKMAFGESIALAVQALTKDNRLPDKQQKMMDSLQRIQQSSKETGIVKLADRITNLQPPPPHWDKQKIANYLEEAKTIAAALKDKNEYLVARLNGKILEYERNLDGI
jgi:(p)ppGpp synthase/HD superfamily hydrolase